MSRKLPSVKSTLRSVHSPIVELCVKHPQKHSVGHNCLGHRLLAASLQRPDQRLMCFCVCLCAVRRANRPLPPAVAVAVFVAVVFKVRVTRKHYFRIVAVPGFVTPSYSIVP